MSIASKLFGRRSGSKIRGRSRGDARRFPFESLEHRMMFSTIVVNSVLDQIDPVGSSIVTLRDAIAAANTSSTSTSIVFSTKVFATEQTIKLDGSRLIIQTKASADTVTITAPTAGLIINGNNSSGDFVVWTNTTATLTGLTITGGKSENGAGVDNYGSVTVEDSTITGNSSPNGGGFFSSHDAYLLDDTISNNVGTTGGGIWNTDGGYVSLTNDTVSGNTGSYGGGIYNGGTSNGTVELHNVTLSNNSAGFGGGVYNDTGGTVGLSNTIIAGNKRTSNGSSGTDVAGVFASRGYNLIGNTDGGSGFVSTDLTGNSALPLAADLNPLGNYGGPTDTMTPKTGSPALGAGSPALISGITTDQRGLPRVVDGKVDIGSTENQTPVTPLPAPTVISPGSTVSPGPVLTTLTPTFEWKAVTTPTITGYQLNLYDNTTAKFYSYTISSSATSFTIPAGVLIPSDSYVWNLRVLEGSTSGPPSAYLYFQTPAVSTLPAPTVISPGSTVSPGPVLTTFTPTFAWKAVTTPITGYELNLYDNTTAKFYSYNISSSATSFTIPAGVLTPSDSYVWNLRVLEGSTSGPPSTYLYFQTPAATALPIPIVLGPGSTKSPGPVVTTTTPTFTWDAVPDAATTITGYQLNLYDYTTAKFVSYVIPATATSFTVPTALTSGDTFVWNLRVIEGDVTGTESAYLYFQTA
jgi:hypothetical protein